MNTTLPVEPGTELGANLTSLYDQGCGSHVHVRLLADDGVTYIYEWECAYRSHHRGVFQSPRDDLATEVWPAP